MHHATGGKSRLRSGVFLLSCLILVYVLGLCACAITPIPTIEMLDFNKMAGVLEAVYSAMIGY